MHTFEPMAPSRCLLLHLCRPTVPLRLWRSLATKVEPPPSTTQKQSREPPSLVVDAQKRTEQEMQRLVEERTKPQTEQARRALERSARLL